MDRPLAKNTTWCPKHVKRLIHFQWHADRVVHSLQVVEGVAFWRRSPHEIVGPPLIPVGASNFQETCR